VQKARDPQNKWHHQEHQRAQQEAAEPRGREQQVAGHGQAAPDPGTEQRLQPPALRGGQPLAVETEFSVHQQQFF